MKASLLHHRRVPFKGMVVAWYLLLGGLGGLLLYAIESKQSGLGLADAIFLAVSASTCTGLATFNITAFGDAAKALLGLLMVAGSSILISAVPLHLRHAALRRNVPEGLRHVALKDLCRCPEWLVELNSMRLLLYAIYIYQAALLLGGFCFIYVSVLATPVEERGVCDYPSYSTASTAGQPPSNVTGLPCRPGRFAAFVSVAAFANAGMTSEPGSLEAFNEEIGLLSVVTVLALAGNVLYPVLLRLSLQAYLQCIPIDDARRLWARHLLLSGRKMYGYLFSTEQTTTLFLTQLAVWAAQTFTTWSFFVREAHRGMIRVYGSRLGGVSKILSDLAACDADVQCFRTMEERLALPDDMFMSVETRHAGFAIFSLANENTPVLAMYMLAMMMAPVPLMIAVHASSRHGAALESPLHDGPHTAAPTALGVGGRESVSIAEHWARRHSIVRTTGTGAARAALSRSRIRMAEQIDELSLALARIPSVDPRVSAESRTSEASVADLGVLQLQAMLWHGELTWGQTLRHHLTAFSHAVGGFVGGPTLQRDLLFAWLAWFLILAFDPDLPHGSNGAAFDALFEVCSAFGNVGLSMGYSRDTELENVRPGTPQTFVDSLPRGETGLSYCACWPNLSKAVLVAVMIYGRTRALPQQVDYALTLAIEIPSSDMSPPPSRLLRCARREGFTRHNGVRIGRPSSCSSARAGSATATSATRRARAAPGSSRRPTCAAWLGG